MRILSSNKDVKLLNIMQQRMDALSVLVVSLNAKGEILYANKKVCTVLEISNDQIIGEKWWDVFSFNETISTETFVVDNTENNYSSRNTTINKKIIAVKWNLEPLNNADGTIVEFTATGTDISNTIEEDDKELSKEYLFDILMDTIPDRIYFKNKKSQFLRINKCLASMLGVKAEQEVIGNTDFDYFDYSHARKAFLDEQKIIQTGISLSNIEEKEIWGDGSTTWVSTTKVPLQSESGEIIGTYGISRDITQQKLAGKNIMEREMEYRILVEAMSDLIFSIHFSGDFIFANNSLETILGYSKHEIKKLNKLELIHPDDKQHFISELEKLKEGKRIYQLEYRCLHKNNKYIYLLANIVPIYDKKSKKLIALGISHDISKRKKDLETITDNETKLKIANAEKDKFFSIIAHDLKSPFNSMLGFLDLLTSRYDNYDTEKKKKIIALIHSGVKNTHKLLEDLLLWSRTQRGIVEYNPSIINLHRNIEATTVFFQQTAKKKEITIHNHVIECITVKADENMLSTIMRNLISNAIKFTPYGGEIKIESDLISIEGGGIFVKVSVIDTGVGVAPELLPKLFKITENTTTYGTENEKGTGLGLILCKEFVDKHGGKIWIDSKVGEGSTFNFTLPC